MGPRSFAVSGPTLWNSLPVELIFIVAAYPFLYNLIMSVLIEDALNFIESL